MALSLLSWQLLKCALAGLLSVGLGNVLFRNGRNTSPDIIFCKAFIIGLQQGSDAPWAGCGDHIIQKFHALLFFSRPCINKLSWNKTETLNK